MQIKTNIMHYLKKAQEKAKGAAIHVHILSLIVFNKGIQG